MTAGAGDSRRRLVDVLERAESEALAELGQLGPTLASYDAERVVLKLVGKLRAAVQAELRATPADVQKCDRPASG